MQTLYTPAHPVRTDGIPADMLEHPGRRTIIDYVQQHMDHSEYFLSESANGESGILSYRLTLHKGSYTPGGTCSYSLFDSIHLIAEKARVSRATAKQLREHIREIYDDADNAILRLQAQSDQWTTQKREPGQVRFYSGTYELYIGAGYLVTIDCNTKAEKVSKISEFYRPNELGAPQGDVFTGYKYQEYHEDLNMHAIFEKYKSTPMAELDALIAEREERERLAEEELQAEYAREQEAERKKKEAARATLADRKPYLLVKYVHVDDSDVQTDYFSTKLDHCEIIGEYDTPIRTTFAGGRMDIWRLLRAKGEHIDGLKWKAYGGLMALKNKEYTGCGEYVEVKYLPREVAEKDSYLISALSRAPGAANN